MPLKHIHKVTSKGRTYFYAWRGGPRLKGEPGSPEFLAEYQTAWADRGFTGAKGSFADLVRQYKRSTDFLGLAESSRALFHPILDKIVDDFGRMSLRAMEDRRLRKAILEWRDDMAAHPRAADLAIAVLRRVLSFGVNRGELSVNIALRIDRLHSADRSDIVWEAEEIERFCEAASAPLAAAVKLAAFTGLRRGDLLALRWEEVDAVSIKRRAQKTRTVVVIPLLPEARAVLGELSRSGDTVLVNSRGAPWTDQGFAASFKAVRNRLGIPKRFHDLRGTAVTRFIGAGLSYDDVALVVGWSRANVEQIAARYVHRSKVVEAMLSRLNGTKREEQL